MAAISSSLIAALCQGVNGRFFRRRLFFADPPFVLLLWDNGERTKTCQIQPSNRGLVLGSLASKMCRWSRRSCKPAISRKELANTVWELPDWKCPTGSVEAFAPVTVQRVPNRPQRQLFKELVGRYHYLGYTMPCGPRCEVVECVQFSSPAWRMKARDQWIGWDGGPLAGGNAGGSMGVSAIS